VGGWAWEDGQMGKYNNYTLFIIFNQNYYYHKIAYTSMLRLPNYFYVTGLTGFHEKLYSNRRCHPAIIKITTGS